MKNYRVIDPRGFVPSPGSVVALDYAQYDRRRAALVDLERDEPWSLEDPGDSPRGEARAKYLARLGPDVGRRRAFEVRGAFVLKAGEEFGLAGEVPKEGARQLEPTCSSEGAAELEGSAPEAPEEELPGIEKPEEPKRKRGRPRGSKNKPKAG